MTLNAPLDFTDPATGRSYRLFQSNFAGPLEAEKLDIPWSGPADPPPRLYLSVLTVNHDPGRGLQVPGLPADRLRHLLHLLSEVVVSQRPCGATTMPRMVPGLPSSADSPGDTTGPDRSALLDKPAVAPECQPFSFSPCCAAFPRRGRKTRAGWTGALGGGCRCWTAAASCPWTPSPAARSREISGGRGLRLVPSGTAAEVLLGWLVEPEKWEEVSFLPAADPALARAARGAVAG